jgi:hypothetical protein
LPARSSLKRTTERPERERRAFAQAVVDKYRARLPEHTAAGAWVDARNADYLHVLRAFFDRREQRQLSA